MAVPSIGINSFQGDTGVNRGAGLRVGILAGSRLAELLSLNVAMAFDVVNVDLPGASDYVFDLGFNPLFHFPLNQLEIVAGPLGGVFVDKAATGGVLASDTWAYGWTAGANAGVLFAVGSRVRLGGLLTFSLRNPLKVCITAGGMDNCMSEGITSHKVLGLSFAALL